MAEYWTEVSNYLSDKDYSGEVFDQVGVAFLERGPITENTTYYKVRDPAAPAELEGKTVELIFSRTITNMLTDDRMDVMTDDEVRAWVPEYKHEILERKAR